MTVELVTSWHTLFEFARAEGQARLAHKRAATEQTAAALQAACTEHEAYRQMCIKADRMIPGLNLST